MTGFRFISIQKKGFSQARALQQTPQVPRGAVSVHGLLLVLFSIAAGFTASAIVTNLYRISGLRSETPATRALRSAVLVLAGPSVLFESAMRGFLAKTWTPIGFWLAAGVTAYWSLFVGLLVVDIAIHM
jgi:hypothetical protein